MKRSLRYPLALACLILAAYCILREAGSVWMLPINGKILDFSSDSQSFWTYALENDEHTVFTQHDVLTGKVIKELRRMKERLTTHSDHRGLSTDGSVICSYLLRPFTYYLQLPPALKINLVTDDVQEIPDPGLSAFTLSPTSRWLMRIDVHSVGTHSISIVQCQGMKQQHKLYQEETADRETWSPTSALFSTDEKLLCVAWNQDLTDFGASAGELRFYETSSWEEVARHRMLEARRIELDYWDGSALLFHAISCDVPNTMVASSYRIAHRYYALAIPTDWTQTLLCSYLFQTELATSQTGSRFLRDFEVVEKMGHNWHARLHTLMSDESEWLVKLRKVPLIRHLADYFAPKMRRDVTFYRTATLRKLSTVNITHIDGVCISPDGQWLMGRISNSDLVLYSTAPLTRWPGYLLGLAGVVLLFWRRNRSEPRQRPESE